MSKLNQKYALIFVFIVYVCVQFLFVTKYYTDKTTVPPQIAENMFEHRSLVAQNFLCYLPTGGSAVYPTWAEEPPVFHFVVIAFKMVGLDLYYYKLLPILCFSFVFIGLMKLASLFLEEEEFQNNLLYVGLIFLFQPYFYIHFARILPDNLSLAFLVWSVYFFFKRHYMWAIPLAFFAVTTKALAIFPLAFIVGFYFFFERKEKLSHRFIVSSLFALSLTPTLLWFYYLKSQGILSPFFSSNGGMHHMAGTAWDLKVWTRVLHFGLLKGISIPVFLLLVFSVFRNKKKKLTYLYVLLAGYIATVFLVKDIFKTAPWYSFYFIAFFAVFMIPTFVKFKQKWKVICVLLIVLSSISTIDYSFDIGANVKQVGKELFIDLPCQDYLLHK